MDGATLSLQHDNVQKQMSAYEKLLQHAVNKFSTEKLHHMLRAASKASMNTPRGRRQPYSTNQISSLKDLRKIVKEIKEEGEHLTKGLQKDEEIYLLKYFKAFFEDVAYLQNLKRNFDENIYMCLYDYFYNPEDDVEGQFDIAERNKERGMTSDDEMDSGRSTLRSEDEAHTEAIIEKYVSEIDKALHKVPENAEVVLDELNDKEKLSYAVRELFNTNQKWDQLFDEDHINELLFDEDSEFELRQLKDYEEYELILRLVPDIFVKSFKCLHLGKLWWTQANKVYEDLPTKRNSAVQYNRKVEDLEKNVAHLRLDIMRESDLIGRLLKELASLENREQYYNDLGDSCERLETQKNEVGEKYNNVLVVRESLKRQVEQASRGSHSYAKLQLKLKENKLELLHLKGDLDTLEYHSNLLRSDFDCAMTVRPELIYFSADLCRKISVLEESVVDKKKLKRENEKKLVLLRTNCDRMRQIMRKYVSSLNVSENKVTKNRTRAALIDPSSQNIHPNVTKESQSRAITRAKPVVNGSKRRDDIPIGSPDGKLTPFTGLEKNRTFLADNSSDHSYYNDQTHGDFSQHSATEESHTEDIHTTTTHDKTQLKSRAKAARKQPEVANSIRRTPSEENAEESKQHPLTSDDGNEADVETSPRPREQSPIIVNTDKKGSAPARDSTNDSILNRQPFPKRSRIPRRTGNAVIAR